MSKRYHVSLPDTLAELLENIAISKSNDEKQVSVPDLIRTATYKAYSDLNGLSNDTSEIFKLKIKPMHLMTSNPINSNKAEADGLFVFSLKDRKEGTFEIDRQIECPRWLFYKITEEVVDYQEFNELNDANGVGCKLYKTKESLFYYSIKKDSLDDEYWLFESTQDIYRGSELLRQNKGFNGYQEKLPIPTNPRKFLPETHKTHSTPIISAKFIKFFFEINKVK